MEVNNMKTYSEEHVDELLKMNELLRELNDIKDQKILKLENKVQELESAMDEIREVANELTDHIKSQFIGR